jgi:hypothetical protein
MLFNQMIERENFFFVFAKISAKISFIFREIFRFRENPSFSQKLSRKFPVFAKIFAKILYIFRENFRDNKSLRENLKFSPNISVFAKILAKIACIFRESFRDNKRSRENSKFSPNMFVFAKIFRENRVYYLRKFSRKHCLIFAKTLAQIFAKIHISTLVVSFDDLVFFFNMF